MELKDPGIKLFGRKIAVTEDAGVSGQHSCTHTHVILKHYEEDGTSHQGCVEGHDKSNTQKKAPAKQDSKESLDSNESPKTSCIDEEIATMKPSKSENDKRGTTDSHQKTLKKPDKILPCPRCNSMDTKFCYYNNYNVNQPRYFCKSCQRYWTSGGTMRNMPVGAGRRKSKISVSHCHQITLPEALIAAQIGAMDAIHNPTLKENGTVLSFGKASTLKEVDMQSISCVLNLDKNILDGTPNGIDKQGTTVPCKGREYRDDCSSGSSISTSNSNVQGTKSGVKEPELINIYGFPPQVPFNPVVPWPCAWNPAVPVPAIGHSGLPLPYYPTPYWNFSVPSSSGMPWLPPAAPATDQTAQGHGPKSPILGKHSRKGELLKPSNVAEEELLEKKNSEGSVLVPKILRIDDLDEAAKSSIWASLGIQNDSISNNGFFNAFQPKKDEKHHVVKPSPVLHANPAALSRSLGFQERA